MDTIEAIHSRRSIRAYRARGVERGAIEAIILDAAQAPSTPVSGAHPWIFHVIEGSERIAAYGARAKQFARAHRPPGEAGYAWADRPEFSVFLGAPVVIVICGDAKNSEALAECCRAGQNLMLSAHARGLGTCWVGSPLLWLRDGASKAELGIAAELEPHAVFTLGYAAEVPAKAPRVAPQILWSA
ncbi:MAG TPA: nitroreductase family protein [Rhizomicrobium sp.]